MIQNNMGERHNITPQAKEEGTEVELKKLDLSNTPTIKDEVFENLPPLLYKLLKPFLKDENERIKDIVLLSSMATLSSCMPKIHVMYGQEEIHPNLYLGIFAKSRSGKGNAKLGAILANEVHNFLLEKSKKEIDEFTSNPDNKDKEMPVGQGLKCPSDVTTAMLIQLAKEWEKGGIFISTGEIKTLTGNKAGGHVNHDSFFLSAYHHESYGVGRKTTGKGGEREIYTIDKPMVGILATGVKSDINTFFEDEKSGLFQRFLCYIFDKSVKIVNPLLAQIEGADMSNMDKSEPFRQASKEVLRLYKMTHKRIRFTKSQSIVLTSFLENLQTRYKIMYGSDDMEANIITLGLQICKFAMIMTNLRRLDSDLDPAFSGVIDCSEVDFNTSLSLCETMIEHSETVYATFNNTERAIAEHNSANSFNRRRSRFLKEMPKVFNSEDVKKWAKDNDFVLSTVNSDRNKLVKSGALKVLSKDGQLNRWEKVL